MKRSLLTLPAGKERLPDNGIGARCYTPARLVDALERRVDETRRRAGGDTGQAIHRINRLANRRVERTKKTPPTGAASGVTRRATRRATR
jgi:hypothetical protein